MSSPLFSCVVPVKGARPFIADALASLESQGMGEELEIIVQDGGVGSGGVGEFVSGGVESGGVEKVVSGGVESGGVRYYREDDNGQSDALNKGFAKAKGEWLFWLNADDVLLPGALKKVLDRINWIDRIDWIAGDTVYLDEKGIVKDVRTDAKWRIWFGKKLSVWTGGPSAFFRRELWEKRGGFDAELKYVMDIDLWTRWAQAGERFATVDDYLWGFRMHAGSATMGGANYTAQREEKQLVLERHGIKHEGLWRNVTRVAKVLDGTWARRKRDARKLFGMPWQEIGK